MATSFLGSSLLLPGERKESKREDLSPGSKREDPGNEVELVAESSACAAQLFLSASSFVLF